MKFPTPGNADTPVQKKHREQLLVAGTLVLVILTLVIAVRRKAGASGTDPSAFTPTDQGASGTDNNAALASIAQQLGSLPGQFAAILQGQQGNITITGGGVTPLPRPRTSIKPFPLNGHTAGKKSAPHYGWYEVKAGDTLAKIESLEHLTTSQLRALNGGHLSALKAGEWLQVRSHASVRPAPVHVTRRVTSKAIPTHS